MDKSELLKRHKRATSRSSGSTHRRQFKPTPNGGPNKDGKYQIRLVPWNPTDSEDKWRPFKDMYFHYGMGTYGFPGLTQFDEPDPIQEMIDELKEEDPDGNKETLKKLYPKRRVFALVVERENESKGIQFWQFGPQVEADLVEILLDEEILEDGDPLDFSEGLDIRVIVTQPAGEEYPKTRVKERKRRSPLGTSKEVKAWLADLPDLMEAYDKKTYDEVAEILKKWHSPPSTNDDDDEDDDEHLPRESKKSKVIEQDEDDDDEDDDDEEEEEVIVVKKKKKSKKAAKKAKAVNDDVDDDDDDDFEDIDEAFADLEPDE